MTPSGADVHSVQSADVFKHRNNFTLSQSCLQLPHQWDKGKLGWGGAHSSGMLGGVIWWSVIGLPGYTLEDGTDRLSRNVGNRTPTYAT